jgi:F-type H+-transporting ATPase subunit alpha
VEATSAPSSFLGEVVVLAESGGGSAPAVVAAIQQRSLGALLLEAAAPAQPGSLFRSTGAAFSLGANPALLGSVLTPASSELFRACRGARRGRLLARWLVEATAPSIIFRRTVSEPLQTGMLSLDALVPVGLGQRELVVGDRRTGKTSLSLDTIIAQEGAGMVCVFAAIGQRAAALLGLAFSLFSRSLTDFLLFVAAFSFDSPSLQYFCPYAAATVSEFFMWSGQIGAFTSYDDLSKHAGSYREIYLLLKRPPGREAYPGEIFFVHSRLLERAAKLSLACGGGSVTAFPVIETLAGDVSSYISTNVISITDGQIFMAMELFAADRRPPVDFTLSVTRVGSAAQWAGVKALCGSYKVQLSQYFELAAFSQFSSDLGADTLRALKRGRLLVALLKQGCGCPMVLWEELLVLGVSRAAPPQLAGSAAAAMLFLRLAPEWLAVTVSARLLVGAARSAATAWLSPVEDPRQTLVFIDSHSHALSKPAFLCGRLLWAV